MSAVDPDSARAHLELLARARDGTLTGPERAALVVLLDRLLVAVLLDEEDGDAGRYVAGWHRHVAEAYQALVRVEAASAPPPRVVGGAEVRSLRRCP